jgi:hypothetical protein
MLEDDRHETAQPLPMQLKTGGKYLGARIGITSVLHTWGD